MYQNSLIDFNPYTSLSAVEVGKHLYWKIGSLQLHGQVFIVSWLVIATLLTISFLGY